MDPGEKIDKLLLLVAKLDDKIIRAGLGVNATGSILDSWERDLLYEARRLAIRMRPR